MNDTRRYPYTSRPEVETMIDRHATACAVLVEKLPERLRALEIKFATLIGLMCGSGFLGGVTANLLRSLFP